MQRYGEQVVGKAAVLLRDADAQLVVDLYKHQISNSSGGTRAHGRKPGRVRPTTC